MPDPNRHIALGISNKVLLAIEDKQWTYDGELMDLKESFLRQLVSSLVVVGAPLPFLVVEVADSEPEHAAKRKIYQWTQGSKGNVKIIILLRIEYGSYGVRACADIVKSIRLFTRSNPARSRVMCQVIVRNKEVYPTRSRSIFYVGLEEVIPNDYHRSAETARESVAIGLGWFHNDARRAVEHSMNNARRQAERRRLNPLHGEQDAVWSPRDDSSFDESLGELFMQALSDGDGEWVPYDPKSDQAVFC
ncbi:MAG: hypothetical protein Q9222_002377 [Ikaeria aurantiellina]